MTFQLPEKDPDPELSEIEGEKTLMSKDGKTRLHLPYDGMGPVPIQLTVRANDGQTATIEEVDDGRGGYTGDEDQDRWIEERLRR